MPMCWGMNVVQGGCKDPLLPPRHMGPGGAHGRVITIGSTNCYHVPWAGFNVYGMGKAAIVGLTEGPARDLGPRGITVNNVQPGPLNTDMNPADGPMAGHMQGLMAQSRHAHPDEIAGMVTGASLLIDRGFAA
jgi:3-oxoacyl-[acyl-carrier protein] reductase